MCAVTPAPRRARLSLDRVADDAAEVHDRDVQDHHQEHELPDAVMHRGEYTRAAPGRTDSGLSPFSYRPVTADRRRNDEDMSTKSAAQADGARRGDGLHRHVRVHTLVQELELDDDELNGLYEQIEERGIELTDDCGLPESRADLREQRGRRDDDRLAAALPERGRPLPAADRGRGGRAREARSSAATARRRTG